MKFYFILLLSVVSCYAPQESLDSDFLKAQTTFNSLKNLPARSSEQSQAILTLTSLIITICEKREIDLKRLKSDPSYKVDKTLNPEEQKIFMNFVKIYEKNSVDIEFLLKQTEYLQFKSESFKRIPKDNSWSTWAYGYYNYYSGYCTLV